MKCEIKYNKGGLPKITVEGGISKKRREEHKGGIMSSSIKN